MLGSMKRDLILAYNSRVTRINVRGEESWKQASYMTAGAGTRAITYATKSMKQKEQTGDDMDSLTPKVTLL